MMKHTMSTLCRVFSFVVFFKLESILPDSYNIIYTPARAICDVDDIFSTLQGLASQLPESNTKKIEENSELSSRTWGSHWMVQKRANAHVTHVSRLEHIEVQVNFWLTQALLRFVCILLSRTLYTLHYLWTQQGIKGVLACLCVQVAKSSSSIGPPSLCTCLSSKRII